MEVGDPTIRKSNLFQAKFKFINLWSFLNNPILINLPFLIFCRVVSYIKNGWEDDFIDKRQGSNSSSSKQNEVAAPTSCEFLSSVEWISLRDANESVPAFSMQNVVSYFIERKAKDNESNKDYKNVSSKAFGLFRHEHVRQIELATDNDKVHFRCNCLPEIKKKSKV